uniref:Large proline-rich protein BAG6 n=1 Tax=Photinus pyralis TaxID=7054 RepID=A0A1Y1L7K7_PHOPY
MIVLTVKTLDSRNHDFTVEDDITVAQFKEHIADTVNIPADTQRIIYCGRILQDSTKLSEYDVNGKVVHLVQRPPPSTNQPNQQRPESPTMHPHMHRRIRGVEYLGSLRLPANAMDQMPPLPTHSLAASRLNVAKRMLRRANTIIGTLENPTRPTDQSTQDAQGEVTPVFEARVIVPNVQENESLERQDTITAINSLMNALANEPQTTSPPSDVQVHISDSTPPINAEGDLHSASSTPETTTPLASSSENLTAVGDEPANPSTANEDDTATSANTASNVNSDTISRTTEYAELLESLNAIQTRFAPFMEQYLNFMREDPTVTLENARSTQAMINRVSEVLHTLGHAYHSLSDIIVRVRTPPPRPLLCRPILIQHSAIVQAGIPIQLEAQINFSSDRNGNGNRTATTQSQPSSTSSTDSTTTTTASTTAPSGHIPSTVVGFPLIPGVRVETIHFPHMPGSINIDRSSLNTNNNNNRDVPQLPPDLLNQVHLAAASAASAASGQFGNDYTVSVQTYDMTNASVASNAAGVPSNVARETSGQTAAADSTTNSAQPGAMNNPVEFFMEVTPESITIDSLETAIVGGDHTNEILQGALNPPPELIQSIMQMAGQIINRGAQGATGNISTVVSGSATPSAPQSEATTESQNGAAVTSNGGAARVTPFQNSQARGNTQTQPTTATHTRSTPRPHVHLAQHAMQGFDPFLPCNSHHVTRRRQQHQTIGVTTAPTGTNQAGTNASQTGPDGSGETRNSEQNNPLYNIMRTIINTVHNAYTSTQQGAPPSATANASTTTQSSNPPAASPRWVSNLEHMNLSDSFLRNSSPTISQLLQQFSDETHTEGESIFSDLIMLLSRNLTISDVIHINSGRLEPLIRIRTQLRNFFLYRVLDGCQTTAAIDRGVERLLTELEPFLEHLGGLPTRDDIDIVRSVQTLLRARLPNIISLVTSRSPNSLKMVVDQIRTTGRQLCALAVRASQNGRQGVENIFNLIVTRYMQGIPQDLQQWTLMTSRGQMSLVLSTLDVPESILQPYIVREIDAITPSLGNEPVVPQENSTTTHVELMQVDDEVVAAGGSSPEQSTLPAINLADDPEPLPQVVFGSESWHGQVPSDWVPIIARDTQRQRRQNSQPPFSDAYLSGMPSKRRKIVTNSKPQGSLPQVITESVRQAVSASGLSSVAPIETVAAAAGADLSIQTAYRNLLRSSVQSGLTNNEDFTPERFPNANNYFNNYPQ